MCVNRYISHEAATNSYNNFRSCSFFFLLFFLFCPSNSVLPRFNLFVFFLVCFYFFFWNTNIVVHYIIGKAGNELVSFFNSLYQDD